MNNLTKFEHAYNDMQHPDYYERKPEPKVKYCPIQNTWLTEDGNPYCEEPHEDKDDN